MLQIKPPTCTCHMGVHKELRLTTLVLFRTISKMDRQGRGNLGFLLAKAMQRWNELLYAGFCSAGYAQIRPSFGSILVPLFEEDGLRMGELARRSRLSKQTMTTMVRLLEREGLVTRRNDRADQRATRVHLTDRAKQFRPVARRVMRELETAAAQTTSRQELAIVRAWICKFSGLEP